MLVKENIITEKFCEIPVTLEDISESIFGGLNTKNGLMHRLAIAEENVSESFYLCEGLCKPVIVEPELVYPYVSGNSSEKFGFYPASYRFMLPYEGSEVNGKKEYKVISPEDLKANYPMAYNRVLEFKKRFRHDSSPLNASDYSINGNKLLTNINTSKIIVTEGYHLNAAFDTAGDHLFEQGCGIVLKDKDRCPYVTSVLNSSIAKLYPSVYKSEIMHMDYASPAALKRFPIVFPDNELTEELITTISGYLDFLNKQKYEADYWITDNWIWELTNFYEQISDLLILDTYFINDLDPRLLEALEDNIHPYAGDMEAEDSGSLINALYYIKQQILETSNFGKYRFNAGLPGVLGFLQKNLGY